MASSLNPAETNLVEHITLLVERNNHIVVTCGTYRAMLPQTSAVALHHCMATKLVIELPDVVSRWFMIQKSVYDHHSDRCYSISSILLLMIMWMSFWFNMQPVHFPSSSAVSYTRYRMTYKADSDSYARARSISSSYSEYTLKYLEFEENYTLSIRAELSFIYCYSYLYGDYSESVTATTKESRK